MALTRPVRGTVLITAAVVVLAAGAGQVLWPKPAPVSGAPAPRAAPGAASASTRPYGVVHVDGLDIPSPQLHAAEADAVHELVASGLVVQRIDPSPWDGLFDSADADIVSTTSGSLVVLAPVGGDHPLWVCPGAGGAVIGGGDVPAYQVGVGGDRVTLQVAGAAIFARVGDALVETDDLALWRRLQNVAQPVLCPAGQ